MRLAVANSAMKRSNLISYSDILFVCDTGDLLGADAEGKLWILGTTPAGLDVELILGTSYDDEALLVIHAFPMKWRKR